MQGVSAKPIIDIDVVIEDYSRLENVISALEKIGYRHEGDLGIVGRAIQEYSRIKEEGAELYPYDINRYIEHKSPFIGKIYTEIGI